MGPPSSSRRVNVMVVGTRYVYSAALILLFCNCCVVTAVNGREESSRNEVLQQEETEVNTDLQALLQVKESLVDSSDVLSSWDVGSTSPCNWTGVICRARDLDSSQPAVVSLVLSNCKLSGTISSSIDKLTHLEVLQLGSNFLTGQIPPQIGNLSALRLLDLSFNSLTGSLPSSLGNLSLLEEAIFDENDLTGEIPSTIGNLLSCMYLSVQGNRGIRGLVPASLKVIPELNLQSTDIRGPLPSEFYDNNLNMFLYLNNLNFSGSSAPDFSRLTGLRGLYMRNTGLAQGPIPLNLSSAYSLQELDLSENRFVGEVPEWITNLPNLKVLLLSNNELSGSLPRQLGQNSGLSILDVSGNELNGTLPEGLCDRARLESLNLSGNRLEGSIPSRLGNCSTLFLVNLASNFLSGPLPSGLGFTAANLSSLDLSHNFFGGSIPWKEFGSLEKLLQLDLSNNRLSGSISSQIGNLRRLRTLNLSFNILSGSLPPQLHNCTALEVLLLQGNYLEGPVPMETLSELQQLMAVNLAENRMEGNVEAGAGFSRLKSLNFSRNSLTGSIPSYLSSLRSLQSLDLSRNRFSGPIPGPLDGLRSLRTLDLSFNALSGSIPSSLLSLQNLDALNLSYNLLSGSLPPGRLPWPTSSFIGNDDLCLSMCFAAMAAPEPVSDGGRGDGLSKGALAGIIVGSAAGLALIVGLIIGIFFCSCCSCCRELESNFFLGRAEVSGRKTPAVKPFLLPEIFKGFSYPEIMAATRNLSEENAIGRGGYGTVFRGDFPNGLTCAVKQIVLEQESSRSSFQNHLREVEIAGQTRHKNIVNLIGFCQKADETLIVYEFMPNGSLGDALHRRGRRPPHDYSGGRGASITSGQMDKLNWRTRFNILYGAASAIDYMHSVCRPQLLHRDIKSNNILLDGDLEARITDFGMAKMVENAGVSITNMAVVSGSAGYLAPEYYRNMRITDKSDVYSFGVVILETLTGMYPTEHARSSSSDDFNLVEYVITTLRQEGVLEAILDTALQEEVIESQRVEEQITLVLQIGLLSTVEDPPQRPSMREVIEMLDYSKAEHGKVRVPDLADLLQDLTASPPMTPHNNL